MTITLPQIDLVAARARVTPSVHPAELIQQLLQEQSTLSAAEQFSEWHETHGEPAQAKHYRNLLPVTMPVEGQQLAFQVDLDRCSGCKACVVACHSLNGLDDGESFRDVGLLLSGTENSIAFQHVTTACHHCVDPGCLNACPVNAYEKDPVTGIVRHLDDQCFGCQYCTLACPYEVPKYNAARGIVRKCDMCSQRLAVGEAPACVQACPHQAISIRTIETASAVSASVSAVFLPDSPDPRITLPTTLYVGKATGNRSLRAGKYATHNPEHAHWPLVILLIFSQIAVGITTFVLILSYSGALSIDRSVLNTAVTDSSLTIRFGPVERANACTLLLMVAGAIGTTAAVSSTLHLGRPQFAYRAILGIGHSWLSREIVAFGAFIPLCVASAWLSFMDSPLLKLSLSAAVLSGVAGVAASAMIYHVTRRPFWNAGRSAPAFLATSLGVSSLIVLMALQLTSESSTITLYRLLAMAAVLSGLLKVFLLRQSLTGDSRESQLGAVGLRHIVRLQAISSLGFLLLASILTMWPSASISLAVAATAISAGLVSEFTERFLFFRAVVPLRMPGVVKS